MKKVSLDRIRVRMVIRVSSLLAFGIIVIAFLATPLISLAYDASDNGSSVAESSKLSGLGPNGCLSQQNLSQQALAKCLGIPDLSKLTSSCGKASSGSQQDCGIPNLSNLTSLCGIDLSGLGNNNPNGVAAGTNQRGSKGANQKGLANCGIPDLSKLIPNLSNLTSLCGIDLSGLGNNPNSISAATKQKDLAKCLGIPDLSNLASLPGLGNNPNNVAARTKLPSKQSTLPTAKLAGIVQFSTIQPGQQEATRQTATPQRDGALTLAFKIVPVKVASIVKGDFIEASFNNKLESGIGLGNGEADLFDANTGQLITVRLT